MWTPQDPRLTAAKMELPVNQYNQPLWVESQNQEHKDPNQLSLFEAPAQEKEEK